MELAIFDLDNTLLAGDSDHAWGEFLVEQQLVDGITFKEANDKFYADYVAGTLDIFEYQAFALGPICGKPLESLTELHNTFMQSKIESMLLPKANALIQEHKDKGHELLIITATNRFITAPIAKRLGIENLLATDPEIVDNCYTGNIVGTPCFQAGKVKRLAQWLEHEQKDFTKTYFYSDSANDIPLLSEVDFPVAVDADDRLVAHAKQNNWPIISLRDS